MQKGNLFTEKETTENICLRNSSNSERELESKESSSEEEHKVNALASGAEEGRDKLRKAAGSCK